MDLHPLPRSPRVLVADDSSDIRTLWQLWLTRSGFLVDEACNGAEALIIARQHRPDVIVIDIQMPVMDGVDAIRHLREDPVTAGVPILVVTAQGTDESVARARLAGADAYFDKPVMPDELLQHIRAVCTGPRRVDKDMVRIHSRGFTP